MIVNSCNFHTVENLLDFLVNCSSSIRFWQYGNMQWTWKSMVGYTTKFPEKQRKIFSWTWKPSFCVKTPVLCRLCFFFETWSVFMGLCILFLRARKTFYYTLLNLSSCNTFWKIDDFPVWIHTRFFVGNEGFNFRIKGFTYLDYLLWYDIM